MTDPVDRRLGDFHLLRLVGSGGMADVYLAQQISLQRHVAVKILKRHMVQDSQLDAVAKFRKEAMLAAGLNHPNIVQVYTIGVEEDIHYIAQEFVHGTNLLTLIGRTGNIGVGPFLVILRQIAAALKASGNAGIVHRDIKPGNILVTKKGEAKVADFGTGLLCNARNPLESTSLVTGTPSYMSPEQISGQVLDPRTDIYSLGVSCYQMLCGDTPFHGTSSHEIVLQHLKNEPIPLKSRNKELPSVLCDLVHVLMAKERNQRYQSATDLLEDVKTLATAFRQGRSLDKVHLPHLSRLTARPADQKQETAASARSSRLQQEPASAHAAAPGAAEPVSITTTKLQIDSQSSDSHRRASERTHRDAATHDNASDGSLLPKSGFAINHDELIDMTAMVDIVFFLLIFFLVTSMNGVRASLPMPVPKTTAGMGGAGSVFVPETEESRDDNSNSVAVTIDANDRVRVEGELIQFPDALPERLQAAKGTSSGISSLLITGHGDATHGTMVGVLDAGQEAGFESLRFTIDNSLED